MKIERTMQGSMEECFTLLAQSYVNDANSNQKRQQSIEDLRVGNNFKKELTAKLGNSGLVEVTLVQFDQPSIIEINFRSAQGINKLVYELSPIDDNSFQITYSEDFESEKKSNSLNYKLMSRLSKRKINKAAKLTLDRLEMILNQ